MQDELLLRQWTAAHAQFSLDLDRLVTRFADWGAGRVHALWAIGRAYAADVGRSDSSPHAATNTLLSGLAAVATTALLFTAVALVAGPSPQADGIASPSAALASGWKTASSSAPGRPD